VGKSGWTDDVRKRLRSWLEQLSGTSWIGVLVLASAILIALIEFLMHLKDARQLMTSVFILGLRIEPKPDKVEIQGWLFFLAFLIIFLLASFFLLWMRAEFAERNDDTVRTLRGVMRAAGHICKRLFPAGHVSDLTIEKIHVTYQIEKDFTAQVRRIYRIRAGKAPVYFIERGFRVRDHADPADSLIDIDFRVRDMDDPGGVVYLPMANDGRNKSACVFFLPRIEPGEHRSIELYYKWPGMARTLKIEGEEEFTLRHTSAGQMDEFRMEIYLEPGSGGTLSWEESGRTLPNKELVGSKSQLNWPGVSYRGSNISPEITDAGIRLRLRWKKDEN
jgi:hypothetical protein